MEQLKYLMSISSQITHKALDPEYKCNDVLLMDVTLMSDALMIEDTTYHRERLRTMLSADRESMVDRSMWVSVAIENILGNSKFEGHHDSGNRVFKIISNMGEFVGFGIEGLPLSAKFHAMINLRIYMLKAFYQ